MESFHHGQKWFIWKSHINQEITLQENQPSGKCVYVNISFSNVIAHNLLSVSRIFSLHFRLNIHISSLSYLRSDRGTNKSWGKRRFPVPSCTLQLSLRIPRGFPVLEGICSLSWFPLGFTPSGACLETSEWWHPGHITELRYGLPS